MKVVHKMNTIVFVWYLCVCGKGELFVQLPVEDISFCVCVTRKDTIFPKCRN